MASEYYRKYLEGGKVTQTEESKLALQVFFGLVGAITVAWLVLAPDKANVRGELLGPCDVNLTNQTVTVTDEDGRTYAGRLNENEPTADDSCRTTFGVSDVRTDSDTYVVEVAGQTRKVSNEDLFSAQTVLKG